MQCKPKAPMGYVNLDAMILDSGVSMTNCYITLTPSPPKFPFFADPIVIHWNYDLTGTHYIRDITYYVYASKAMKDNGFAPLQTSKVTFPATQSAQGVLTSVYGNLKALYFPNVSADDLSDMH